MAIVINIDNDFDPTKYKTLTLEKSCYPGGEINIRFTDCSSIHSKERVIITIRPRNSNDIMTLMFVKDALERLGAKRFELIMPYVPYARQDKVYRDGESFTLKVFAKLINDMKFDKVTVMDTHSIVTDALIDNLVNIPNTEYVRQAVEEIDLKDLMIVSPDAGALKKTERLFKQADFSGIIRCDKQRDAETGKIMNIHVNGNYLENAPCLVVDDICDGGGTMLGIADVLSAAGAGKLFLFVTHGIFSKGTAELYKHFKTIYCTDSFRDISGVRQYNLTFL